MSTDRRELLRKLGAAGATLAATGVAGCAGGGGDDDDGDPSGGNKVIESDLPEDRKVGELAHVSNTERYYAARYQANTLVDKRLRDRLGVNAQTDPVEITVLTDREANGEFDLVTYNWTANNGDPDSIIVNRFHGDGSLNYYGFDNEEYNELAMQQRAETDDDARQELVMEAQKILGEQRVENQYLYNVTPYAYNSDRFVEDSLVVTVTGLRNIWNYTQIEPNNEEGNTIVTNNWDPSDQLNPLNANAIGPSRNWTPTRFMHDFLFRPDPDLKPAPWAAEGYEWVDDTTLDVTLKDGQQFHDGESLTTEDVVYTFELILETEPPAYLNNVVEVVDSIEDNGDGSVTFGLQEAFAPFLAITLGSVPLLPKHYWEQIISETGASDQPWQITIDNDRPVVGSGPFQFGQWDQGSRFRMPAFKDHPFAAPNIDTRVQRPLSTRDAELEAMLNGDYDLLDYWFGDPANLQSEVESNDHLGMVQNAGDGRQATWVNTARPPFDDVAFRQAVNAVIMEAQPTIIEELYEGFGNRAASPINETLSFWHNPDTPAFEGGTEAAVQILADAGYVWDEDENLYYPEGMGGG